MTAFPSHHDSNTTDPHAPKWCNPDTMLLSLTVHWNIVLTKGGTTIASLLSKSLKFHLKWVSSYIQERTLLEDIGGRVYANEWSDIVTNWRSRIHSATSRTQIIEAFELAVQDIISKRPNRQSFSRFPFNFFRKRQPRNYVSWISAWFWAVTFRKKKKIDDIILSKNMCGCEWGDPKSDVLFQKFE